MTWLSPPPLTLPPGPDGKPGGPPPISTRVALGLLGAILGSFVSNLDTRLTTFTLSDLRGGVGYGVDESSWVSAAYNIAEIAVVPITPWLAGVLSPRRCVAFAVSLLTVAGAFVPLSAHLGYTWVVAARFLQGVGGGALIPLLLSILLRFLPMHQRVYGFAIYAMLTATTPLVTESVAGILTDIVGWQSVFYLGALIGPVVLLLVLIGLPLEPIKWDAFRKADYLGMFLLVIWPSLLTAALGEGQRLDWFDSPLIDALFIATAIVFVVWLVVELTHPAPLIDLTLLLRRNFSGGMLTIVAFSFATLVTSSVMPQYGTSVRGFRETDVGNILVWAALSQLFVLAMAPLLLQLLEARIVLALGLAMATAGAALATYIDSDWVRGDILPSHILEACGQPLIMVPLILIATSTLQMKDALAGGTTFNIARTLAGSVGGAVVGAILTVRERVHSNTIADHLITGAPATTDRLAQGGLGPAMQRQATTMAVADTYGWIAVITLCAILVAFALNPTPLARAPKAAR